MPARMGSVCKQETKGLRSKKARRSRPSAAQRARHRWKAWASGDALSLTGAGLRAGHGELSRGAVAAGHGPRYSRAHAYVSVSRTFRT